MTSLLNNLDKLEAADNNTKEPDPTNMVDEDKMVTLVDILICKKASRDNKILRSGTRQSFKYSVGSNCFLVKELEKKEDVFAHIAFYSFWFWFFLISEFLFIKYSYFVQILIQTLWFVGIEITLFV